MSSRNAVGAFAFLVLATVAVAPSAAQSPRGVAVLTTAGRLLEGELLAVDADGVVLRCEAVAGDGDEAAARDERLARREVVAIAALAPRPSGDVRVELVGSGAGGGDVLRGRLAAGDEAGDTFVVDSPVLGRVELSVDRLRRAVFEARAAGAGPLAFELPADVEFGEAVFRRAQRGFDRTLGSIFRFGDDALAFARSGQDEPRELRYDDLAAIAVRGGFARDTPASAILTTRAGDRLRVDELGFAAGTWTFALETGRELALPAADVAAVSFLDENLVRLADQPFAASREHALAGPEVAPLWRVRRGGEVADGGVLRAAGRGFGDGLGVHAFSELSFTVPEGVSGLVGLVAIDDAVLDLGVRGSAAVEVLVDGRRAWSDDAVRVGQPPRNLGRIPVTPGGTATLRAGFGAGFDLGDRVDWLEVAFVR